MTQALDSLSLGRFVDFKGSFGKFEYLGRGECVIGGEKRLVKRLVMICAGSGITPIFQVLRAVMDDEGNGTRCLVLDGNRGEGDILCREEIDALVRGREGRCRLVFALTRPKSEGWMGARGRIEKELLEREVGRWSGSERGDLVLICGPAGLEKSVHSALNEMGWRDDDLLFF